MELFTRKNWIDPTVLSECIARLGSQALHIRRKDNNKWAVSFYEINDPRELDPRKTAQQLRSMADWIERESARIG